MKTADSPGFESAERRQLEDALAASQRRLEIGLESAGTGVYDWNIDTGEVYWTDENYRLVGLLPQSEPASYQLWVRHIHPDDVQRVQTDLQHALASGERFFATYRIVRADGEVRWMQGQGLLFDSPGEPKRMVGAMMDITDRKLADEALRASEARFRLMADGLPTIVWVHDAEGRQEFVNQRFCEVFGVSREVLEEDRWKQLGDPAETELYWAEFHAAVREQRAFYGETRARQADGQWRWFASWARPRFGPDGTFQGHVGTSADVTDLKLAEQALREADRRKDEFIATLSHELRNPLAPIRTAAQLLGMANLTPQSLEMARRVIDRQVNHMARLLDDLLDVARITGGRLELKLERILISSVVEAAIETVQPLLDARGHRLSLRLPVDPVEIAGDPVRLAQVFSNLLANAAKYTDPGGEVEFSLDRADDRLVATVRDNGMGIKPDALDSVFNLFAQAEPARSRAPEGLGIGLALVKGIVDLHGGRVSASSEGPGRGSEFRVELPVSATPSATAPRTEAAAPAAPVRRILVADDNRDAADTLATLLRLEGHEVRVAYDGREAVTLAMHDRPEIALLDIGMPELDGNQVAEHLRSGPDGERILLVAVTGWGQVGNRSRAPASSFDHHLTKPVDLAILSTLIAGRAT